MPDLSITCLSDNVVPFGSALWGEHGLSFFIRHGDFKVLYDTGQSGDVVLHNAKVLDIDLSDTDVIVLSHGHYDHTGGLKKVLKVAKRAKLVAHPEAFSKKYARKGDEIKDISMPSANLIPGPGREAILTGERLDLGSGVFITGQIPRKTAFEKPAKDLLRMKGDEYRPDPLPDDLSIVIERYNDVLLLTGCCHAGIINTVEYVRSTFGRFPSVVAGGLHMANASKKKMDAVVSGLYDTRVSMVMAGHCSGLDIVYRLKESGIKAEVLTVGSKIV